MRRSSCSSFQQVLHIEHGCALRSSSGARGLEVSAKSESGWRQKRYVDEQVRWRRQEEVLQQIGLGLKVSFFFPSPDIRPTYHKNGIDLEERQHSFLLYALAVPASPIALILAQGCSCPKLCSPLLADRYSLSTTARPLDWSQ
jgi:hypothetical protein